jgi:phospholipid/cholesterol/gamma-HCH transport system substrate-binding protein
METRAKYVTVGAFVLAVAGMILGFAFWLGLTGITDRGDPYLIYFDGTVTGLQEGSQVRYRGIPVGQVRDIAIDFEDIERVRVVIEVESGTPLREDSVATLELSGLTGGSFVQITGGTQDAAQPQVPEGEVLPVIASEPSTLDSLAEQAPDLLGRLLVVTDRAAEVLSDENREAFNRILANADDISTGLVGQAEVISATTDTVRGLMTNIDALVTEFRIDLARASDQMNGILSSVDDSVTLLEREAGATSAAAQDLLGSVDRTARSMNSILATAGPGLQDFANNGLYEFTVMTTELRELARNFSRVLEQVERSPTQFLLGPRERSGIPVEQ